MRLLETNEGNQFQRGFSWPQFPYDDIPGFFISGIMIATITVLSTPEMNRALLSRWTVPFKQTHIVQIRGLQIQLGNTPS